MAKSNLSMPADLSLAQWSAELAASGIRLKSRVFHKYETNNRELICCAIEAVFIDRPVLRKAS